MAKGMSAPTAPPAPRRRSVIAALAGGALALAAPPLRAAAQAPPLLTRPIPSTGERVPAIGMGTWITFNVGADERLRAERARVLQGFFDNGGTVIDSSPMYGSSEAVLGWCLDRIYTDVAPFAATKVWTWLQASGPGQMAESRALWGVGRFDLMQVHNLLNWDGHLETLRTDKAAGRIRYIGVTTSHGSRHDEMAEIMRTRPIDAVQLSYSILDRAAEARLLPLAAERGLAVIVNRPFRTGALFRQFGGKPLPGWAGEIDCANWAQFFLKFIVSHPAVTCAIPATSRVDHMNENMGALRGPLPDATTRRHMVDYVETL
jgi:aryl-alcohol dehydrogenase-like predicted oxidoreductase